VPFSGYAAPTGGTALPVEDVFPGPLPADPTPVPEAGKPDQEPAKHEHAGAPDDRENGKPESAEETLRGAPLTNAPKKDHESPEDGGSNGASPKKSEPDTTAGPPSEPAPDQPVASKPKKSPPAVATPPVPKAPPATTVPSGPKPKK
jgi:hypothetical protein